MNNDMYRFKLDMGVIVYAYLIFSITSYIISISLMPYANSSLMNLLNQLSVAARYFIMLLGFLNIVTKRIKVKKVLLLFVFMTVSFFSWYFGGSFRLIDIFFVPLFFSEELEYKKVIKLYLVDIILSAALVIFLHYCDYFPYYVVQRSDGRVRLALGFAHPNTLGMLTLLIVILVVLLKDGKIRPYEYVLFNLASLWVYRYPNSITSSILIFLFTNFFLVLKLHDYLFRKDIIRSRMLKFCSIVIVPAILIFVYYKTTKYSGSGSKSELFYYFYERFAWGMRGIKEYGIHLFGNRSIEFAGSASVHFSDVARQYFIIDCFYMYMLVAVGIVPTLFYFSYYAWCIFKTTRLQNLALWIALLVIAIFYVTESSTANILGAFMFICVNCQKGALFSQEGKEIEFRWNG